MQSVKIEWNNEVFEIPLNDLEWFVKEKGAKKIQQEHEQKETKNLKTK